MSPRRKLIHKWSRLGFLGLFGFFAEIAWLRDLLFLVGGLLLAIAYALGMQIEAERLLSEKRPGDPRNDLG